jgi:hypothetical protein
MFKFKVYVCLNLRILLVTCLVIEDICVDLYKYFDYFCYSNKK